MTSQVITPDDSEQRLQTNKKYIKFLCISFVSFNPLEGSLLLNMNGHTIGGTEQQIHHQLTQHAHLGGHHTGQTTVPGQTLVTNGQQQQQPQHLYDYYKLPLMVDGTTKAITLVTPDGKSVVAAPDGTLQEMVWR